MKPKGCHVATNNMEEIANATSCHKRSGCRNGTSIMCSNWSTVDLNREPRVAYLAIARSGSGTLKALLSNLYGLPNPRALPHDHVCHLAALVERVRVRPLRVLVPLRPMHERIASGIARAHRRQCRPPSWPPACLPPRAAAGDRYVEMLQSQSAMAEFGRPSVDYLSTHPETAGVHVAYVCTHRLRVDVSRALATWGVANASTRWSGVPDMHVDAAPHASNLSARSVEYLRWRYASDYELVARHGCDGRNKFM